MKNINICFRDENEKKQFVLECEEKFHKYLKEVSKSVIDSGADIVLLSGPTCSGKTTLANKIIHDFKRRGNTVIVVSIDGFFKERNDSRTVEAGKRMDYDSIDALDFELLKRSVSDLKAKRAFSVPIYDFLTQKRAGYNNYKIDDNTVVIFEGIQAVYPEVSALLSDYNYVGIFSNINEDVIINGAYFSRDDIRLSRRIVRDKKFRGATADFSMYLWETVRENEDKNIYPNKNICKIQMDSFLEYELFVLKKYIIEILDEVEEGSAYYDKAMSLRKKFEGLCSISYEYVPNNSLYTEFLGRK